MRLAFVIVFSVIAALAAAGPTLFEDEDEFGCVPLDKCPKLNEDLKKSHYRSGKVHLDFTEILKKLACGFIGRKPLVCCPPTVPSGKFEIPVFNINYPFIKIRKTAKCVLPGPSANEPDSLSQKFNKLLSDTTAKATPITEKPKEDNVFSECGQDFNRNHNSGNVTEISDFPWLALLEYDTLDGKKFLCGGTLISDQYVLTSADCATNLAHNLTSVHLGQYELKTKTDCEAKENPDKPCTTSSVKIDVDKAIIYDKYRIDAISPRGKDSEAAAADDDEDDIDNLINDIFGNEESAFEYDRFAYNVALLQLKEKVNFNQYIQPICLPDSKPTVDKFLVSGWSKSMIPKAEGFDRKKVSQVTEVEECSNKHPTLWLSDDKKYICAGLVKSSEYPCFTDGGGALMGYEKKANGEERVSIFGISTMDQDCKMNLSVPGVYTPVLEYKDWIVKHIANKE